MLPFGEERHRRESVDRQESAVGIVVALEVKFLCQREHLPECDVVSHSLSLYELAPRHAVRLAVLGLSHDVFTILLIDGHVSYVSRDAQKVVFKFCHIHCCLKV